MCFGSGTPAHAHMVRAVSCVFFDECPEERQTICATRTNNVFGTRRLPDFDVLDGDRCFRGTSVFPFECFSPPNPSETPGDDVLDEVQITSASFMASHHSPEIRLLSQPQQAIQTDQTVFAHQVFFPRHCLHQCPDITYKSVQLSKTPWTTLIRFE